MEVWCRVALQLRVRHLPSRCCQLPSQSSHMLALSHPHGKMSSKEVRCLERGGTELPPDWANATEGGPLHCSVGQDQRRLQSLTWSGEQHGLVKIRCPDFFKSNFYKFNFLKTFVLWCYCLFYSSNDFTLFWTVQPNFTLMKKVEIYRNINWKEDFSSDSLALACQEFVLLICLTFLSEKEDYITRTPISLSGYIRVSIIKTRTNTNHAVL